MPHRRGWFCCLQQDWGSLGTLQEIWNTANPGFCLYDLSGAFLLLPLALAPVWHDNGKHTKHFSNAEAELQQIVRLWVRLHTQTCTDDTCEFSDSPLSTACSFSRLRISGLAALMSIFRLEVGVQGSLDGASRPLVGVVSGAMLLWLSSDEASDAEALFEFFSGVCGSTKTCPWKHNRSSWS